jgi:membrane protein DedA with SNARE-associated domain
MKFDFGNFIGSIIWLVIGVGIVMFFQLVFWPTYRYMKSNDQGWLFVIPVMLLCFGFIYWREKKDPSP